jgi:hypothetical protein
MEMKQGSRDLQFSIAFPFAGGQLIGLLSDAALAARGSWMLRLARGAHKIIFMAELIVATMRPD